MAQQISLNKGLFALVDDADYGLISQFGWTAAKGGKDFYAIRLGDGISMHRFLMNAPDGLEVDHKNGSGLDNQRLNLRICTHKENIRNKKKQPNTVSRFKGVWLDKSGKWRVSIEQNGQKLHLGGFSSEFAAARQYDRAARIFFGQFAKTNEDLGLFDGVEDRIYTKRLRKKRAMPKPHRQPAFNAEMQRIGITPRFAGTRH